MQAVIERPNRKSNQLIHMYSGVRGGMMMEPLQFISGAGILDRHLVVFRDPENQFYHGKISPEMNNIDANIQWQRESVAEKAHITELYCAGTSLGAYAALLFGHYLEADAVHAFGPITKIDMSWWARQDMKISIPRPPVPRHHLNLATLLANWNGKTQFHIYYSAGNEFDAEEAGRMSECPNVHLHPIPGTNHNIFACDEGKALLPSIFPPPTRP